MWEQSAFFEDGLYCYTDGRGNTSVISKEWARNHESDYYEYQARMDVDRGGANPEGHIPKEVFQEMKRAGGNIHVHIRLIP